MADEDKDNDESKRGSGSRKHHGSGSKHHGSGSKHHGSGSKRGSGSHRSSGEKSHKSHHHSRHSGEKKRKSSENKLDPNAPPTDPNSAAAKSVEKMDDKDKPKLLHAPDTSLAVQQRRVIEGEDREGDFVLEEPEVLPYDSVFEWDVRDPIGYYREDTKFQGFLRQFKEDEEKLAVVQGMWRDRIKYQLLRRFEWPPKMLIKTFFSRGYYEDYPERPTVDIETLHLLDDKNRLNRERMNHHRMDPRFLNRKKTLSEFDPLFYDRHILIFSEMPADTDPEFFKMNFPTGKLIETEDDGKGGKNFWVEFKSFEEARIPYKAALDLEYNGSLLMVEPPKKPPPRISLSEYDPAIYNRHTLIVKGIPKNMDKKTLKEWFGNGNLKMTDGPNGTQTITASFKKFDDARRAFRVLADSKINGKFIDVEPEKWTGPGRSLSDFDPMVYNRNILTVCDLPKDVDKAWLEKAFPKGTATLKDDGKGGKCAEIAFNNFDDSRNAFKHAINEKLPNGQLMAIIPKKWDVKTNTLSNYDPKYYNREILQVKNVHENEDKKKYEALFPGANMKWRKNGTHWELDAEYPSFDESRKAFKDAQGVSIDGKPVDIAPKKRNLKSLSDYDPNLYNREILTLTDLPKDVDKKWLTKIFPKGQINLKDNGKGGFDLEVGFNNFADARAAFKKAVNEQKNGEFLPVTPKLRDPMNWTLSMFDPEVYQREVLTMRDLPKDVDRNMLKDLFPGAKMHYKPKADGTIDAAAVFPSFDAARQPYKKAIQAKINGKPLSVLPLRRSPPYGGSGGDPQGIKVKHVPPPPPPPPPPPVVLAQRRSLSDYDPAVYKREILQFHGLPSSVTVESLQKLFPNTVIKLKEDGKGTFVADVKYPDFEHARVGFRKAIETKVKGHLLNVIPKLRSANDDSDDDEAMYANPYLVKSKLQQQAEPYFSPEGHAQYFKTRPKTKLTLKNWNHLEYDLKILEIHNIPLGTQKLQIEKWFPKGTVKSFEPDPEEAGKMISVVEFKVDRDAERAFHENHDQLMNGSLLNIFPAKMDPKKKAEMLALEKEKSKGDGKKKKKHH